MNNQVKININDKYYYCDMEVLKLIERLNNIINELEKVIDYELLEIRKNNDYNIGLRNVQHIYKRLQELKEGKHMNEIIDRLNGE